MLDPPDARVGCRPTGTALAVPADGLGELGFTPPDGAFPADYAVSVTADMRQLPGGCTVLGARMTGANGYRDAICANGDWSIDESDGSAHAVLAHGAVAREGRYQLTATADGDQQSLAVNGVTVARVRNSSLTSTAFVLVEAADLGPRVGSAVLSDFAFTPLP